MPKLVPVDNDPFAQAAPAAQTSPAGQDQSKLVPVDNDPFAGEKLQPPQDSAAYLKGIEDQALKRDGDVDYKKGLSFWDKTALDLMDNPTEKQLYLSKKYGVQNVGQDQSGDFYVQKGNTTDGKVSERGGSLLKRAGAALTASVPQIGGAIAGAVGGGFGAGPVGAIAGAGAGAMAGKEFGDNQIMKAMGVYDETPQEAVKNVGIAGAQGALGEGGGRLLGAAAKSAMKDGFGIVQHLGGLQGDAKAAQQQILNEGGTASFDTLLPKAPSFQAQYARHNAIAGVPEKVDAGNLAVRESSVKDMLRAAKVPEDQLDDTYKQLVDRHATSSTDFGNELRATVQAQHDALEGATKVSLDTVDKKLGQSFADIDKRLTNRTEGDLTGDVSKDIDQTRQDGQAAFGKVYKQISRLMGDKPLVGTTDIKNVAQGVVRQFATTEGGVPVIPDALKGVLDRVADLPERVNFAQAQTLRRELMDRALPDNLVPGVQAHNFSSLGDAIDRSIQRIGDMPDKSKALELYRDANKRYAQFINKYKDTRLNQLVQNARSGVPLSPEEVASKIAETKNPNFTKQVLELLQPETRKAVAQQDWRSITSKATQESKIDGTLLKREIDKRGKSFDLLYGNKLSAQIREAADGLLARDGKIDIAEMKGKPLEGAIRELQDKNYQLKQFADTNFINVIANPDKYPEGLLSYIVQPGNETRLMQAAKTFGLHSPQMERLRQEWLKNLVSKELAGTTDEEGNQVIGIGIRKALAKYSKAQMDILAPGDMTKALHDITFKLEQLFPKHSKGAEGGQIAASGIKNLPTAARIPFWLHAKVMQSIYNSRFVRQWLVFGLNSQRAKFLQATIKNVVKDSTRIDTQTSNDSE